MDLQELRLAIRDMAQHKQPRHTPLFKALKEELSSLGYWKNKPRGDAEKGYKMGLGKRRE